MTYIHLVYDTMSVGQIRPVIGWVARKGPLQLCLVLAIAFASCLADRATTSSRGNYAQPLTGTYVLGTDVDSVLRDTLLALRIVRLPDGARDTIVGAWVRADRTAVDSATGVLLGSRAGDGIRLEWMLGASRQANFEGVIQGDSIVGVLEDGGRIEYAGLRALSLDSSVTPLEPLTGWFDPGDKAVIVLRLDDTRDSDRALFPELERRQLKADFAVITRRVGTPRFLSWEEIGLLQRAGFGIVAHSRLHDPGSLTIARFAWEAVGSKNDLLEHGLDVRWFAIPGSWTGESYLDSAAQVHRARGRLLRRYFEGTLAWVYDVPQYIPLPDTLDYGLSHINCDHFVVRNVMANIRLAIRQRGYLELTYHSYLADKSLLLPVWDSLALLRDQGLIVLVSSAVGSHAARDGAPALIAAGGGPLGSSNVALSEDAPGACRATAATLDSATTALDPECAVRVRLRRPPRGTAVAIEAGWVADSGRDTLTLTLRDAADPLRSNSRSCVASASETYCTVRLGVAQSRSDVIAEARRSGSLPGRAFLKRSAVLVQ